MNTRPATASDQPTRSWRMIHRRLTSSVLAAATLIAWSAAPASACQGPPFFPTCSKILHLAVAGSPGVLTTAGGPTTVPALVFFDLAGFPPTYQTCPGGPYTVDLRVTADCTPGPDGSGELLAQAIVPGGYTPFTIPLTIPAGPQRQCEIQATATIRLADGMELSESATNVVCIADPAPGSLALPRLDIDLVGAPGDELARIHPGDQAGFTYQITNNDPTETFGGFLTLDSRQESRLASATGPPGADGVGVVSVSDPVEGDHFPIAFADELLPTAPLVARGVAVPGCIGLPADPTDPAIPTRVRPLSVPPGSSIQVDVFARPWGMCANGSCGRSTLVLTGDFTDLSPGLGCAGFVIAADTSVAPSYQWPDAGQVGHLQPINPQLPMLRLSGEPFPDIPIEIDLDLQPQLIQPLPVDPISFTDSIDAERGRIQVQFVDTFAVDSFFDVQFDLTLAPGPDQQLEIELLQLDLVGEAPSGFEQLSPFTNARLDIQSLTQGQPDASGQLNMMVSGVGIDNLNARRPLRIETVDFTRKADGSGLTGRVSGRVDPVPGDRLEALELSFDLRGFFSPEPQGDFIFTDGFESGNVTRWSSSTP